MSDVDEFIFRGTSAQECEDFIRYVKRVAVTRGKEEDDRWIARYAASGFAGVALRWIEGLDDEFQHDWRKLRKAMLQRWPADKTEDIAGGLSVVSLVPSSPAAAPPPAPLTQAISSVVETPSQAAKRGYIRVDGTPSTRTVYLDNVLGSDGSFGTTIKEKARLLVEIIATKPPYPIKVLNVDQWPSLALKWGKAPVMEKGSTRWAKVGALNEVGEYHPQKAAAKLVGPHRASIWSVAMDGTIQAWWEEGVTSLMEAMYHENNRFLVLAPDKNAFINRYPDWMRVSLVFEPAE